MIPEAAKHCSAGSYRKITTTFGHLKQLIIANGRKTPWTKRYSSFTHTHSKKPHRNPATSWSAPSTSSLSFAAAHHNYFSYTRIGGFLDWLNDRPIRPIIGCWFLWDHNDKLKKKMFFLNGQILVDQNSSGATNNHKRKNPNSTLRYSEYNLEKLNNNRNQTKSDRRTVGRTDSKQLKDVLMARASKRKCDQALSYCPSMR